jgi:hypothetical protein
MAARTIPLRNRAPLGVVTQMVPRRLSRYDAVRRLMAVARANALDPRAVTEENIAIVAEFNLFPKHSAASRSKPK